ncbi:MAG: hypothetical protein AB7O49_19160 [Sphingomonadales bacterium]
MPRMNRHWASLVYPLILALMGWIYFHHEGLYHEILYFWGASRKGVAFSDLNSILTQVWCYGQGFDPYAVHAERPECRGFAYSPFLLELAPVLPSPDYRYLLGVLNLLTFSAAIQFLPIERRRSDHVLMGLAFVSAPVIWLLETSNLDLLFIEGALIASFLLCRGAGARLAGYVIVLVSASLKFYPIVLMGHLARERPRVLLLALALLAAGVAAFVLTFLSGVTTTMNNLPRAAYFQYCWGAVVLPLGVYYLTTGIDLLDVDPAGPEPRLAFVPYLVMGVLIGWSVWRAFSYSRDEAFARAWHAQRDTGKALMVSGCLVVAGCFMAWANLPYRQAFLLLALPGMLAMKDPSTGRPVRLVRVTAVLLIALMWWDTGRVWLAESLKALGAPDGLDIMLRLGFWMVGQAIWWHAISVIGAILLSFLLSSPAMNGMLPARFRRR